MGLKSITSTKNIVPKIYWQTDTEKRSGCELIDLFPSRLNTALIWRN
jgi:hypothetical protein